MLGLGSSGRRQEASSEEDRIPFRVRFKAWWEGYELHGRAAPAPLPHPQPSHKVRYERQEQRWETTRLRLVQALWGEGFCSPGGAEHILNMAKFFGLDPAMSVLDLGAGLGGATRAMAEQFGVWITGLEADPALAEAGMALSVKAGMAKKAPIAAFDPETFEHKQKSIDCAFSKEFLFTVADKRKFLRAVEDMLKPKGQFLFTDYVLATPHQRSKVLDFWIAHEHRTPHPWAEADYRQALAELHLDIRVVEDMTDAFHRLVTKGWSDFIRSSQDHGVDPEATPALLDELEIWTRRMQALESGDLKVCRFHVLKKNTDKLLSNW